MKTELALFTLLSVAFGCTREPQHVNTFSPEASTAAQLEEVKKSSGDERGRVVIGQVIGTQNELVSDTLQQAGIDCIVQGDEYHEISVPKHKKHEAVDILAKDSRLAGCEIIWATK